jgi:membrane protein YdbS with pleckstrin-like domain
MTQDEERLIRPPIEPITSGRMFRPSNAFLYKKMLKVGTVIAFIWLAIRVLFIGLDSPWFLEIALAAFEPLEILTIIGWETASLIYIIAAAVFFALGSIYSFVYVRRIEYSAIGWSGDAIPEIYSRKGIINITKRHLPFRTVVNVRTRRGPFDRLFRIGTVLIETAGGSTVAQATGLAALVIQRLTSDASEERIEGITFHEELRDFILGEMRAFGRTPAKHMPSKRTRRGNRVLNRETLDAFIEIRNVLRARSHTRGVKV